MKNIIITSLLILCLVLLVSCTQPRKVTLTCPDNAPYYWKSDGMCHNKPKPAKTPRDIAGLEFSCSSNDECDWIITNCCDEMSGAFWQCANKIKSNIDCTKRKYGCEDSESPKPLEPCQCVEGKCELVEEEYEEEPFVIIDLIEGKTKKIMFNGKEYEIKSGDIYWYSSHSYNFFSIPIIVNNEQFNLIDRDILQLEDDKYFGVLEIVVDMTSEYPDFIKFYLGKDRTNFEPPPFYDRFCSDDEDCVKIPSTCCDCGAYNHDYTLNKKYEEEYLSLLNKHCENIDYLDICEGVKKGDHWTCTAEPKCVEGKCELVEKEEMGYIFDSVTGDQKTVSINNKKVSLRVQGTNYDTNYANVRLRMTINNVEYNYVRVGDLIKLKDNLTFTAKEIIVDDTGNWPTSAGTAVFYIKDKDVYNYDLCSTDEECIAVAGDCCGCGNGGTNIPINEEYAIVWNNSMYYGSFKCVTDVCDSRREHPSCHRTPKCVHGRCALVK